MTCDKCKDKHQSCSCSGYTFSVDSTGNTSFTLSGTNSGNWVNLVTSYNGTEFKNYVNFPTSTASGIVITDCTCECHDVCDCDDGACDCE